MLEIKNRMKELGLPAKIQESILTILAAPDATKLIHKLQEPVVHAPSDGMKRVLILDTETTGVNTDTDEMIELGYVIVEFDTKGSLGNVVKIFNQLQQPTLPILNSNIHGIFDKDVLGQAIDFTEVSQDVLSVQLVVAHNSGFDRKIVERYIPEFKNVAWACTFKDIDWKARNISSAKLEFLAFKSDFFYEAHRASIDVFATLEVIKRYDIFIDLVKAAMSIQYIISAKGSPFSAKDALKARGYKPLYIAGKFISWYTQVIEADLEAEKRWLKKEAGCRATPTKAVSATDRYSSRENF